MPTDAELLQELATLDEVVAWIPTATDHAQEVTPEWCEVVLEVKRDDDGSLDPPWPLRDRMPLRRHDGELIIQVLHDVLHPGGGGQVARMLWSELDDVVDRIQKRVERDRSPRLRDVGRAQGLTTAIAIMVNPFAYDEQAVRDEAMERHEARHGCGDPQD